MTPIPGTTKAQTIFLRAFRTNPAGPPPDAWPAPAVFRRWLRRRAFRSALESVRNALRFQADFQLSASATQAIKCLADSPLTVLDINRLLRTSHIRQRFAPPDSIPTNPAADQQDDSDDEQDDDPTAYKCPLCRRRAPDPLWIGDPAIFKQAAFRAGYVSPLQDWPDFPPPVPQDTFYYQLIQDPFALLWYMHQYDQSHNDHRFQPILLNCKNLIPHDPDPNYPRFASQPALPKSDHQPAISNAQCSP